MIKNKFVIFDPNLSEFLKKFKQSGNKIASEWGSCYNFGTEDIKIKDDVPLLFDSKKDAKLVIKKIKDVEKEIESLVILSAEPISGVIIDWKNHD